MKKVIYSILIPLLIVSGIVFAKRKFKSESVAPKPLSVAEKQAEMIKWEATLGGKLYKKWQTSAAGIKVLTSAAKLSKAVSDSSRMEALVTSLTLPPGSRLGFGMMIKIDADEFILTFGPEKSATNIPNFKIEFAQLHSLKVNDKISIKSHFVSHAPKYAYAIVSADYVEKDHKVIYKRAPQKGGC